MARTTSIEFRENFQEYQQRAEHEPVEIAREGRSDLILMSAEHYDWLRAAAQRTHRTSNAMSTVIEAVENAAMTDEHKHLNDLLK